MKKKKTIKSKIKRLHQIQWKIFSKDFQKNQIKVTQIFLIKKSWIQTKETKFKNSKVLFYKKMMMQEQF